MKFLTPPTPPSVKPPPIITGKDSAELLVIGFSGPLDVITTLVRNGSYDMMVSLVNEYGTISELLQTYREEALYVYALPDILRESNEALGLPVAQKFE